MPLPRVPAPPPSPRPPKLQHKDTPDNNETTFFDFTDENYARVDKIMAKYPANYRQASIIPLLDLAQRQARKRKMRLCLCVLCAVLCLAAVSCLRVHADVGPINHQLTDQSRGGSQCTPFGPACRGGFVCTSLTGLCFLSGGWEFWRGQCTAFACVASTLKISFKLSLKPESSWKEPPCPTEC